MSIYGSPVVQDLAGLGAQDGLPRRHPGVSPEHRDFMAARAAELRSQLQEAGCSWPPCACCCTWPAPRVAWTNAVSR